MAGITRTLILTTPIDERLGHQRGGNAEEHVHRQPLTYDSRWLMPLAARQLSVRREDMAVLRRNQRRKQRRQ